MISAPQPISLRMDACTSCQLRCPACPTAKGIIQERIGAGYMKPEQLGALLDQNPSVIHVEMSNWGEIFLNPHLPEILKCAHERRVAVTASNGVNLNHAKRSALEALVKYRCRHITVSLDGASQKTYSLYRARGNFKRVIEHIEIINEYKRRYRSAFPLLLWQFIAFGHNEHEIVSARALAQRLGMQFYVKLAWDDFSPVKDKELIRSVTKGGSASRSEYLETHEDNYMQKSICRQLWDQPQINWDGAVLGCCANLWGDFGNAFEDGLMWTLNNEKMRNAKGMVMGRVEPGEGVPCTSCHHYKSMRERGEFLSAVDLKTPLIQGVPYRILRRHGRTIVGTLNKWTLVSNCVLKPLANAIANRMAK